MSASRYLIVNGDDFGRSPGVNRGVVAAHQGGIVTSASLMVRWPDAGEAAALAREHPELSVGLHLDLGEWTYRDGVWDLLYEVVAVDDAASVRREIAGQVLGFRRLVGRDPTHVDSHQHVHLREPVRSALEETAAELAVPLRQFDPAVRYCGEFYGQSSEGAPLDGPISVQGLTRILQSLRPGVTELSSHPGLGDDLDGMYREERAREVGVLCDPRVARVLADEGIELVSFASVRV
jgi:chitin disaccharide deacetylase